MTSSPAIDMQIRSSRPGAGDCRYQALLELLDRPPDDNPGLQRLFSTPSPWDGVTIHSPVPLDPEHDLKGFDCGVPMMNDWLIFHARRTQASGSMKTFVVTSGARVVGYFNLRVGQIDTHEAPERVRTGLGPCIPVVVTDRMAVCREYHGRGICKGMLKDAIRRSLLIFEQAGVRAIVGYPISGAGSFWTRFGYVPSPIKENQVLLLLKDAKKQLA